MDELAGKFANQTVSSIFMYAREAHPGEHYRHRSSMADKRSNAAAFKEQCQVKRPILLDTLDGQAHQAYGVLLNMAKIWSIKTTIG